MLAHGETPRRALPGRPPILSDDEVLRLMRAADDAAARELGAELGVTDTTVRDVRRRKSKRYIRIAVDAGLIPRKPPHHFTILQREDLIARGWTEEEFLWARECQRAGDSVAEICAWSDRPVAEVRAALGLSLTTTLTDKHRRLLELWDMELTIEEIAVEMAMTVRSVAQMAGWLRSQGVGVPRRPAGFGQQPKPKAPAGDHPIVLTELEKRVLASYLAGLPYSHIRRWEGMGSNNAVAGVVFRARKKARALRLQHERSPALEAVVG